MNERRRRTGHIPRVQGQVPAGCGLAFSGIFMLGGLAALVGALTRAGGAQAGDLVLPLLLCAGAVWGVVHNMKKSRHQRILAEDQLAKRLEASLESPTEAARVTPTIHREKPVPDSGPGMPARPLRRVGRVVLQSEGRPGCNLVGNFVVVVFLVGAVAFLGAMTWQGLGANHGAGVLCPGIGAIFFLIGAVAALKHLVKGLLVYAGVGPTEVTLSALPRPGEAVELSVSQSGNLRIKDFALQLVCVESATYTQGTDTVTDTKIVFRRQLLRRKEVSTDAVRPLEATVPLEMPTGAMHSFKSKKNEIAWKVRVEVELHGWPDFTREFPFEVAPPGAPEAVS
jgi:hypothetical protein